MRDHHLIAGLPARPPGAVRHAGLQQMAGPPGQAASLRRPRAAGRTLLCQGEPDLFFSEDPQSLRLAKVLCEHCPVRDACLAGALERGEPWGVWGGQLFQDGRVIAEKRGRGRPRKAVAA